MNNNFAKIFQSETFGQILVKKDDNEEELPEIRFSFNPDQLGICSCAIAFKNPENQDKAQQDAFEKIDLDSAEGIVAEAVQQTEQAAGTKLTFTGEDL